MDSKIEIYESKDNPQHVWEKSTVDNVLKDKYEIYFQNRSQANHIWEKYDELEQSEDNVYYGIEYDINPNGKVTGHWENEYPDMISYDKYEKEAVLETINTKYNSGYQKENRHITGYSIRFMAWCENNYIQMGRNGWYSKYRKIVGFPSWDDVVNENSKVWMTNKFIKSDLSGDEAQTALGEVCAKSYGNESYRKWYLRELDIPSDLGYFREDDVSYKFDTSDCIFPSGKNPNPLIDIYNPPNSDNNEVYEISNSIWTSADLNVNDGPKGSGTYKVHDWDGSLADRAEDWLNPEFRDKLIPIRYIFEWKYIIVNQNFITAWNSTNPNNSCPIALGRKLYYQTQRIEYMRVGDSSKMKDTFDVRFYTDGNQLFYRVNDKPLVAVNFGIYDTKGVYPFEFVYKVFLGNSEDNVFGRYMIMYITINDEEDVNSYTTSSAPPEIPNEYLSGFILTRNIYNPEYTQGIQEYNPFQVREYDMMNKRVNWYYSWTENINNYVYMTYKTDEFKIMNDKSTLVNIDILCSEFGKNHNQRKTVASLDSGWKYGDILNLKQQTCIWSTYYSIAPKIWDMKDDMWINDTEYKCCAWVRLDKIIPELQPYYDQYNEYAWNNYQVCIKVYNIPYTNKLKYTWHLYDKTADAQITDEIEITEWQHELIFRYMNTAYQKRTYYSTFISREGYITIPFKYLKTSTDIPIMFLIYPMENETDLLSIYNYYIENIDNDELVFMHSSNIRIGIDEYDNQNGIILYPNPNRLYDMDTKEVQYIPRTLLDDGNMSSIFQSPVLDKIINNEYQYDGYYNGYPITIGDFFSNPPRLDIPDLFDYGIFYMSKDYYATRYDMPEWNTYLRSANIFAADDDGNLPFDYIDFKMFIPIWSFNNIYKQPTKYRIVKKNVTMSLEDYDSIYKEFIDSDIVDFDDTFIGDRIDTNSIVYGYSYPLENNIITKNIYINVDDLKTFYAQYGLNQWWNPTACYEPNRQGKLENKPDYLTQYHWHIIGIAKDCAPYTDLETPVGKSVGYYKALSGEYQYIAVSVVLTDIIAPENTFNYTEYNEYPTKYIIADNDFDDTLYNENYTVYESYTANRNSYKKVILVGDEEYDNYYKNNQIYYLITEIPAGTYVPAQHWPEMLYTDEHFEDVPLQTNLVSSRYPQLGYYPPRSEIMDNPITEDIGDRSFYRYIGFDYTYYSTNNRAGYIYTPIGSDPKETLNLVQHAKPSTYLKDTTLNCYSYEYLDTVEMPQKGRVVEYIYNTDFNANPMNGARGNSWYRYLGTNEDIEIVFDKANLRSVPEYKIDINTDSDLTIGAVAGASFSVNVQGNIKDIIKYKGRKCRLYYNFNNNVYIDYGYFTIKDVQYVDYSITRIVAYDNISKLDVLISDLLESLTYPISVLDLYQAICDYCEIPYDTQEDFLNSDILINSNIGTSNSTAREIMKYIAQVGGGYFKCDKKGMIHLENLRPAGFNLQTYQLKDYISNDYITYNRNLLPFFDKWAEENHAYFYPRICVLGAQYSQKIDMFPMELMAVLRYNNTKAERDGSRDAILDISDNPILENISTIGELSQRLNSIIDQFYLIFDRSLKRIKGITESLPIECDLYGGEVKLNNFDPKGLGIWMVIQQLHDPEYRLVIPTSVIVNSRGVTVTCDGKMEFTPKLGNRRVV